MGGWMGVISIEWDGRKVSGWVGGWVGRRRLTEDEVVGHDTNDEAGLGSKVGWVGGRVGGAYRG